MPPQRAAAMSIPSLRQQVHQIADALPPEATWDDVRYQVELRASIERGLADADAGRMIDVEVLRREFGLPE